MLSHGVACGVGITNAECTDNAFVFAVHAVQAFPRLDAGSADGGNCALTLCDLANQHAVAATVEDGVVELGVYLLISLPVLSCSNLANFLVKGLNMSLLH